jgi:hypothetical protein
MKDYLVFIHANVIVDHDAFVLILFNDMKFSLKKVSSIVNTQ